MTSLHSSCTFIDGEAIIAEITKNDPASEYAIKCCREIVERYQKIIDNSELNEEEINRIKEEVKSKCIWVLITTTSPYPKK
jgi:predicted ABC-type ATPase